MYPGPCTQDHVPNLYALLIHERKSRPEKFLPKKESKYQVGLELADVICMAIVNADRLGIDIEQAISDKWITRKAYKSTKSVKSINFIKPHN